MADKVPVLVYVDPEQEVTIRPFAAELSKQAKMTPEIAGGISTGSATVTYNGGNVDGDATID